MSNAEEELRWERLLRLLAPIHDSVRATARGLARSTSEGDDLFHDALLRSFAKLSTLREECRFRGWFYTVLLSCHRSRARRSLWRRFLSLEEQRERGLDPAGDDGSCRAVERRRAERASRALATLPAVQREAVVLFELEGFSIEEIAAWQKVSISAVKSRLQRGRGRLRRYYERLGLNPRQASAAGFDPLGSVSGTVKPRLSGVEACHD
jgi:RNA polymerase sigma-70 factor, ECF subfamily